MSSPGLEPNNVVVPGSSDVVVPDVGPWSMTGEIIGWTLASSTQRLLASESAVRLGVDPEGVHQARVATRRLRSDLRTYRSMLDPDWRDELRRELKWFGRSLGDARDLDVLDQRIRFHARVLPDDGSSSVAMVLERLQVLREASRKELKSAMHEPRHALLIDSLVDASRSPLVLEDVANVRAAKVMGQVMRAPWFHLKKICDGLDLRSPDADLHEARIRAKRVRYAAEALAPVFGKPARRFARRAEALQEVLGHHQDAVVAIAWLREQADAASDLRFTAGMLAGIESSVREDARRAWPGCWVALRRKRLRFWE